MRESSLTLWRKLSEIQPQRLEWSRGSVRRLLKDYEVCKSQVARGAKDGISMVPAGVLESVIISRRQVLHDLNKNNGTSMDEAQRVHALKELAGLNDEVHNVQRFEKMSRRQRCKEQTFRICRRSGHVVSSTLTGLVCVVGKEHL